MVDKSSKLFKGVQLILLIAIVQLFKILSDIFTIIEEANFKEVEEKEQVKLFTLFKFNLVCFVNE